MKKRVLISVCTIITLTITSFSLSFANEASDGNSSETGNVVTYQVSDEEYNKAIIADIYDNLINILKQEDISSVQEIDKPLRVASVTSEISDGDEIIDYDITSSDKKPNSEYEYRTVLHHSKAKKKSGGYKYASKQLEGGYKGASHLYYSSSGGGKYSISIGFSALWSPVSVSVSRGIGSKDNIGMVVPTTSTKKYNKVQASKTYKGTPYSIQKRKKGGSWKTFSRGVATKFFSVSARCVEVKYVEVK